MRFIDRSEKERREEWRDILGELERRGATCCILDASTVELIGLSICPPEPGCILDGVAIVNGECLCLYACTFGALIQPCN